MNSRYTTGLMVLLSATVLLLSVPAFVLPGFTLPPQPHYVVKINLPTTATALQDYRTLFSLMAGDKTICSAGFAQYGQTRRASSSQMLELYCQPAGVQTVSLGRPSPASWRPALIPSASGVADLVTNSIYKAGIGWQPAGLPPGISSQQVVGGDIYQFFDPTADRPATAMRDGQVVATFPGTNLQVGYSYAGNVYAAMSTDAGPKLSVCTPPEECKVYDLPVGMRGIYTMLGYNGSVIIGGTTHLLRFDGERVSELYSRDEDEFYSLLATEVGILVGTYPDGFLLAVNPETWVVSELMHQPVSADDFRITNDAIPLIAGHYRLGKKHYREAQALALMGGRVYVGMFPWGEVWSAPADQLDGWENMRMFHGEKNSDWPWPYYEKMRDISVALKDDPRTIANPSWSLAAFWAQRIHSLVVSEIGLAVGKGNFTGWRYDPDRDTFAEPGDLADYGEIVALTEPNSLLRELSFDGPTTTLEFSITRSRMTVSQDGELLISRDVNIALPEGLTLVRGCGPFGPSDIEGADTPCR